MMKDFKFVKERFIYKNQHMKKIIAVFDGLKFSESTLQYAIHFARQKDTMLVGVFLEDYSYHSYKIYDLISEEGGGLDTKRRHLDKKDEKARASAVAHFEKACQVADVKYTFHKDRGIALHELLKESIYADLLVINKKETLTHHPETIPTRFIRDLLADVQCPALLVPQKFREPGQLVLLFDGEPSSVHAIKMVSYILASDFSLPVEIVTVNTGKNKISTTDNRLMKEFIKNRFPHARYISLKGEAETQIVNYIKKQETESMVALGAYRRSKVSRWFRPSMADLLMKETKFPLFIAHNK